MSRTGAAVVAWVSRCSSGAPVAGVELLGFTVASNTFAHAVTATTDADGVATMALTPSQLLRWSGVVVARDTARSDLAVWFRVCGCVCARALPVPWRRVACDASFSIDFMQYSVAPPPQHFYRVVFGGCTYAMFGRLKSSTRIAVR